MFAQAGVIQVDTLDEMFDVAQLLAFQPLPAGRRVAHRRQLRCPLRAGRGRLRAALPRGGRRPDPVPLRGHLGRVRARAGRRGGRPGRGLAHHAVRPLHRQHRRGRRPRARVGGRAHREADRRHRAGRRGRHRPAAQAQPRGRADHRVGPDLPLGRGRRAGPGRGDRVRAVVRRPGRLDDRSRRRRHRGRARRDRRRDRPPRPRCRAAGAHRHRPAALLRHQHLADPAGAHASNFYETKTISIAIIRRTNNI